MTQSASGRDGIHISAQLRIDAVQLAAHQVLWAAETMETAATRIDELEAELARLTREAAACYPPPALNAVCCWDTTGVDAHQFAPEVPAGSTDRYVLCMVKGRPDKWRPLVGKRMYFISPAAARDVIAAAAVESRDAVAGGLGPPEIRTVLVMRPAG